MKDLPGTDTVRLRPIGFYVGDSAGLPAPGVVDQQLGVDAKQLIEQRLVIVFPGLPDGAPGDISHGVDTDGLELFGIAFFRKNLCIKGRIRKRRHEIKFFRQVIIRLDDPRIITHLSAFIQIHQKNQAVFLALFHQIL